MCVITMLFECMYIHRICIIAVTAGEGRGQHNDAEEVRCTHCPKVRGYHLQTLCTCDMLASCFFLHLLLMCAYDANLYMYTCTGLHHTRTLIRTCIMFPV